MKIKLSVFLIAASIILNFTACGSKTSDSTVSSSPSSIVSDVESTDTAKESDDTDINYSSHSSPKKSDSDKNKEASSKAVSTKVGGSVSSVSSKAAVSKSASSSKQSVAKTGNITTSTPTSQKQTSTSKATTIKSEPQKTENTTTTIEKPQEEKTIVSTPAATETHSTINEEPSSEAQTTEEPVNSSPTEWVWQHPPVETDKSTLDPEVAPYAYPYDLDAIRTEMIAYGESLGMHYDDRLGLEDTNWSMYTMSADFRDRWEGYDINPSSFRDDCLGNITGILKDLKETPSEWFYFNVLLLPDEDREGDFKVYVPYNIGDYYNYDEWCKSIEDQL